jgi:hypothetical protein
MNPVALFASGGLALKAACSLSGFVLRAYIERFRTSTGAHPSE